MNMIMELKGVRVLLGVSGGIAAYKAADLVRLLVKAGAEVEVVMSASACRFVTPATFQALSGRPVLVDLWDEGSASGMAHIDLPRRADCIVVAPASANLMARLAHGLADDLLSTLILARPRRVPLLLAPAMNREMWENPATQRNVATLLADGVGLLGPTAGEQACGESGPGRMLEPAEIVSDLADCLQPKRLAGKSVLLTAGPTFEAIDPVRGLTNLSSGKMGYALARAAAAAGAAVTLVSGPVSLPTPRGVRRISVRSAREMHAAVLAEAGAADVFIAVAAVADFRPLVAAERKIKKSSGAPASIELVENPDILAEVAALPRPPLCVGFAAESHDLAAYAEAKRQRKKIPLIVGNLIADGFGGDSNALTLFDAAGAHPLPPAPKAELARGLVAHIAAMLADARG